MSRTAIDDLQEIGVWWDAKYRPNTGYEVAIGDGLPCRAETLAAAAQAALNKWKAEGDIEARRRMVLPETSNPTAKDPSYE